MLQELTTSQINQFAQLWYVNACPDNRELSTRLTQRVADAVAHSRPIRELAGNPLLLTILAIIGRRQTLPRDRQGVYKHAVTVLVARWDQDAKHLKPSNIPEAVDVLGADERHELLRLLARRMQEGHSGIAGNHIHSRELEDTFREYLTQYELPAVQATAAARFMVDQLRERNFILSRYGGEVYGFVHRAFLEYLAADDVTHRYTEDREWDPCGLINEVFKRRANDPAWHEVLLLLTGMLQEQDSARAIDCILELHRNRQDTDNHRLLTLAVQALAEVRKLGRLALQSKAVVDELIAATSKASFTSTPQLYAALPALATFSEFWAGREKFLHWFHARGQFLDTRVVGVSPADVAHSLYRDADSLHRFAMFGNIGQHRSSALKVLSARWPERLQTLTLLRDRAVEDPDYETRAVALEQLATYWAGHPGTFALLCESAIDDLDEDTRGSALRMLAAHWNDRPDTFTLLYESATEDPAQQCRAVTLEQLAAYWREESETGSLLLSRAIEDPGYLPRTVALEQLAAHYPSRPDTLALLYNRALEDPDGDTRAVSLKLLAAQSSDQTSLLQVLLGRALEDDDDYCRGGALRILAAKWRNHPGIFQLVRDRAIEDPAEHCRSSALRMLAAHWRDLPETLHLLRDRAVKSSSTGPRWAALELLVERWRDEPNTLTLVCDRATQDADEGNRDWALELLAAYWHDRPETITTAYNIFNSDSPPERRLSALQVIAAGAGAASAKSVTLSAMDDTCSLVREGAVSILSYSWGTDRHVIATLRETAEFDGDQTVRRAARRGLAVAERANE
jgi:hypothetical protein